MQRLTDIIIDRAKSTQGYRHASGALIRNFVDDYLHTEFAWTGKGSIRIDGDTLFLTVNSSLANEIQIRKESMILALNKEFQTIAIKDIRIKSQ